MSVIKNPDIGQLDPGSLCYSIYAELYNQFFNVQDKKDAGHPWGVVEGDDVSIRLHNMAYGFAYAIAGAVDGGGEGSGSGGILIDYLKKSGGNMSGLFRANYGFEAGIGNTRILETFLREDEQGSIPALRVYSDLKIEGDNLYFGGQQFITYIGTLGTMFVRYPKMDFSSSSIRSLGEMYFGADKNSGVYLSTSALRFAGHDVFHAGNAGHVGADWAMKDATVAGMLKVDGGVTLDGTLAALHGVVLGHGGNTLLSIAGDAVGLSADLDMRGAHAICFGGHPALSLSGADRLQISAPGGDLLLGAGSTTHVRLLAPLTDEQGTRTLLTPTGGAWFPDSLRVAHNFGGDLF